MRRVLKFTITRLVTMSLADITNWREKNLLEVILWVEESYVDSIFYLWLRDHSYSPGPNNRKIPRPTGRYTVSATCDSLDWAQLRLLGAEVLLLSSRWVPPRASPPFQETVIASITHLLPPWQWPTAAWTCLSIRRLDIRTKNSHICFVQRLWLSVTTTKTRQSNWAWSITLRKRKVAHRVILAPPDWESYSWRAVPIIS